MEENKLATIQEEVKENNLDNDEIEKTVTEISNVKQMSPSKMVLRRFFRSRLSIIGLIIVISSKGPMIYVSKRVGKDGKVFNFYKFRSMCVDAEQQLEDLLDQNEVEGGVTFKMENDPRVTKFGKFIRRTSIDELPQLFNILKGDMSIVGPRPCTDREYELYGEKEKQRLSVPQGLTGEWQVHGRSDTTFEEMLELDMRYINEKRGFWYDIGLIFKTIGVVFKSKGAK